MLCTIFDAKNVGKNCDVKHRVLDIDYHFDKVKCRKIEGLMPRLMGMCEKEMEGMR